MTAPVVVESDERPSERYRRLMVELLVARQAAGGKLAPEEEARRADELDRIWWSMTDADQDDYERAVGRTIAKVWRRRLVPLGPQPSPEPPGGMTRAGHERVIGDWSLLRKRRRLARALARKRAQAEPPTDWLDVELRLPRWFVLLAGVVHAVIWFMLGRLSTGWRGWW